MRHSRAQIAAAVLLAGMAWAGIPGTAGAAVIHVPGDTSATEVTGGYSQHGDIIDNEVEVSGSAVLQSVTGGRSVFEGAVRNNHVTISGTVTGTSLINAGSIWGGRSGSGPVTGNTVRLDNADVSGWKINEVIGGEGDAGTVEGNRVSIASTNRLDTRGALAGGRASYGAVTGNTVEIAGSTVTAEGGLYGGLILYGPGLAADGNTVVIHKDSTIAGDIYGGYNPYGDAAGNHVTIDGGSVNADGAHAVRGGAGSGTVSGNGVTISGGTVGGAVYGGQGNGTVTGNAVELSDGTVLKDVYGGQGEGIVSENTVMLSGGAAEANVYSGQGSSTVSGNTVTIGGGTVGGAIYGGQGNGTVTGNAVELSGGKVLKDVYGGQGEEIVSENTVTLSNGAAEANVYGGQGSSTVSGNTATIGGGTVGGAIYGGQGNGTVTGNAVNLSGGTVLKEIYGGQGEEIVSENTVTLSNGVAEANVYGGQGSSTVSGNDVTIRGGTVGSAVYGGQGNGTVTGNAVNLSGGMVLKDVYGGQGDGTVSGNTMTLSGGELGDGVILYGGQGAGTVDSNRVVVSTSQTIGNTIYGGAGTGAVNGNVVELRNGTVTGTIYGGQSESRAVYNAVRIIGGEVKADAHIYGGSGAGTIAGNTVDITGGTVAGTVYGAAGTGSVVSNVVTVNGEANVSGTLYGGYGSGTVAANVVVLANGKVAGDVYAGASSNANGSPDVKYNLMTLSGGVDVSEAHLYGYNEGHSGGGNTLVVDHTWKSGAEAGNFVQSVRNFDALVLQDVTWSPETGEDTPVISIGEGDLTDTTVRLVLSPDSPLPTAEGHMDLIHVEHNLNDGNGALEVEELEHRYKGRGVLYSRGVATIGRLDVYDDERHPMDFQVGHGTAERNPQTDVIADSQTASLAFLNQGADLASDSLDLLDGRYGWGLRTFGLVYGNRSRYDAAGGFRIHGWSEIAGVGGVHPVRRGELAWGVFYENGTGRYDAHNSFLGVDFTGRGHLLYNGGGAAVRLTKDSGVYYEASFRAGTLKSSMANAVMDGKQDFYGFDSRSSYWGAHAGAGWKVRRGSGEWDLYGKYFHTAVDGDRFVIGEDEFVYDGAVSDRVRLGARYAARAGEAWSPYFGLAWQYEFRGDSRMLAAGFEAPERSLRGGTVIGEAGAVWRPSDSPWRASFLLRGYAGEREGFSGTAEISYAF